MFYSLRFKTHIAWITTYHSDDDDDESTEQEKKKKKIWLCFVLTSCTPVSSGFGIKVWEKWLHVFSWLGLGSSVKWVFCGFCSSCWGASGGHMITLKYPLPQPTQSPPSTGTLRTAVSTLTYWSSCRYAAKSPQCERAKVNRTQPDSLITIVHISSQMTQGMLLDAGCWILFHVTFCSGLSCALFFSPIL